MTLRGGGYDAGAACVDLASSGVGRLGVVGGHRSVIARTLISWKVVCIMGVPQGGYRFLGSPAGDSLHLTCRFCGLPAGVIGRTRGGAGIWRCDCGETWTQEGPSRALLISADGESSVAVTMI